jgi:hypothetical protein
MVQKFKQFVAEAGGQAAGKMELVKTDVSKAREHAEKAFAAKDRVLDDELPGFDAAYNKAKKIAGSGKTKRKDMPVISETDVKNLQRSLKSGSIDIKAPRTNSGNPFPKGLTAATGKQWLENGLKRNDGESKDDVVNVKLGKVKIGDLKPIQQQIYFDKSVGDIANFGAAGTKSFATSKGNTFIISSDKRIIDGHHRYLAGVLVDPSMMVNALIIDLPIKELLPLTLSYSDAVGNQRNS